MSRPTLNVTLDGSAAITEAYLFVDPHSGGPSKRKKLTQSRSRVERTWFPYHRETS
jgi:hypothetical protein